MAIQAINSSDSNTRFKNRMKASTGIGLIAGTALIGARKNWLYKGMPTDTFVKSVSKNLEKTMTSDELKESSRINKFLKSVVDPEVDMETLKPQIKDSKELSAAIKSTPDETVEAAITRVFSKPSKEEIKQELLDLQYKTVSDKKANTNTALKLIHDNFDAKEKKLVKSASTGDDTFKMIKNTARKIQVKTAALGGLAIGVIVGALTLVATDVPGHSKK